MRLIQTLTPEFTDISLSYRDFFAQLNRSVRMLRELMGEERGVVSILAPNVPQNHLLLWAAETAGIANPLNPLLSEEALEGLMRAAETDLIVALGPTPHSDLWQKAESVAARLPKTSPMYFSFAAWRRYLLRRTGWSLR